MLTGVALFSPAQAALISVSGPASTLGVNASIISAPSEVTDTTVINEAQQGFNERQGVVLASDLQVDGAVISAGTIVDSHMIFLNTTTNSRVTQSDVKWRFSGDILGVMADTYGINEVNSSGLLGLSGTIYPTASFQYRGLELNLGDDYYYSGDLLTLTMTVKQPGDWMRVITRSGHLQVPAPSVLALMGIGLLGLGMGRRRRAG